MISWQTAGTVFSEQALVFPVEQDRWLATLGYTGWGAGQLDGELLRHGWHSIDGTDELMFDTAVERRWPRGFASLGIDVGHLSATAGTA